MVVNNIKWVLPSELMDQKVIDDLVCENGSPRFPNAIKVISYVEYELLQIVNEALKIELKVAKREIKQLKQER